MKLKYLKIKFPYMGIFLFYYKFCVILKTSAKYLFGGQNETEKFDNYFHS